MHNKNLNTFFACLVLIFISAIQPLNILAQRSIANPSLESPSITANSIQSIAEGTLTGWLTTHPQGSCSVGPTVCRPFERWGSGFNSFNSATGSGNAFVELNAEALSMIYQPVCMTQGESFTFTFLHRGRNSATQGDVAMFRMGIPASLPTGSKPADTYSFPILQVTTSNDGTPNGTVSQTNTSNVTNVSAGNGWRRYGGRYTYTGTTRLVNLGFVSISSQGGETLGNFIDDWQINLSPYIEARATPSSSIEGSNNTSTTPTSANGPSVRISGTLTAAATVTVTVSGGSATIGDDYSLSVPFQRNNVLNQVNISIPAGTYDGVNTGIFPVPFSTSSDYWIEPNETVNFTISSVTGAVLASLANCGSTPITTFTHTITNDDILTSAGVNVSGRVIDSSGRGISGARMSLFRSDGSQRSAMTNSFGYYRFLDLEAGESVILTVGAKRHTFTPNSMSVTVGDSLTNVNFVAQP